MRNATRFAGAAGLAAIGFVSIGSTAAFADPVNTGISAANDNNIQALPISVSGNDIAVAGHVVKAASETVNSLNAPIVVKH